jgi:alpha-D-xyloside xylohydrolase
VYKRWTAFGLLSSHSRLHGSSSYRVPWNYDEEAVSVLSKFSKLKCSLMPYLYRAAIQSHEHGLPVLRSMLLEFPGDPTCAYLDQQYMLGDSLLVAPVFSHDGSVSYYVPAGLWTNLLNGKQVQGPGWQRETHDFMSLPLLARPNAVIPLGNLTDRPDYDFSDEVTLHILSMEDGNSSNVEIPSLDGKIETVFEIERRGDTIHIQRQGPAKAWNVARGGTTVARMEKHVNEGDIHLT